MSLKRASFIAAGGGIIAIGIGYLAKQFLEVQNPSTHGTMQNGLVIAASPEYQAQPDTTTWLDNVVAKAKLAGEKAKYIDKDGNASVSPNEMLQAFLNQPGPQIGILRIRDNSTNLMELKEAGLKPSDQAKQHGPVFLLGTLYDREGPAAIYQNTLNSPPTLFECGISEADMNAYEEGLNKTVKALLDGITAFSLLPEEDVPTISTFNSDAQMEIARPVTDILSDLEMSMGAIGRSWIENHDEFISAMKRSYPNIEINSLDDAESIWTERKTRMDQIFGGFPTVNPDQWHTGTDRQKFSSQTIQEEMYKTIFAMSKYLQNLLDQAIAENLVNKIQKIEKENPGKDITFIMGDKYWEMISTRYYGAFEKHSILERMNNLHPQMPPVTAIGIQLQDSENDQYIIEVDTFKPVEAPSKPDMTPAFDIGG